MKESLNESSLQGKRIRETTSIEFHHTKIPQAL